MVSYYIASTIYHQIISQTISEAGMVLDGGECSDDIYLLPFIKKNFSKFSSIDELIVDISALKDADMEILEALEILKVNFENVRIIILAANRYVGEDFLTQCFQKAIYDLIVTEDYLELHNELLHCLKTGKSYKEALKYKECNQETVVVKTQIKQVVSKVLIGLVAAGRGQGCTHNSIVLSNYLRKKGYMVALVEMNTSGAFAAIQEAYELQLFDNRYFSMNGIDYYPATTADNLGSILGKTYNFILCDFGTYESTDLLSFGKCNEHIIVSGTKPWQMPAIQKVFEKTDPDALAGYHFCFNLVPNIQQDDVKKGMCELQNVWFLNYTENPFESPDFAGAEKILKEYLPAPEPDNPKKKDIIRGIFGRK